MEITCSDKELGIFRKVSEAAASLNLPCYLVGGFVRDKLLDRPTKDADFVCVGDA
ncbi:MAG TPA: tRNA nucleotidyltransferase, partial [Flavisolibacter sp.]